MRHCIEGTSVTINNLLTLIYSFIMAERRRSDILYFIYLMLQLYQQVRLHLSFKYSINNFPTNRP